MRSLFALNFRCLCVFMLEWFYSVWLVACLLLWLCCCIFVLCFYLFVCLRTFRSFSVSGCLLACLCACSLVCPFAYWNYCFDNQSILHSWWYLSPSTCFAVLLLRRMGCLLVCVYIVSFPMAVCRSVYLNAFYQCAWEPVCLWGCVTVLVCLWGCVTVWMC